MRISDWSSDVCSSDLLFGRVPVGDKGLGRLAALRLGKRVVLKTRPISNPGIEHCLRIDWEEFITVEHVEDVGIEVLSYEVEQGHGTDEIGRAHVCTPVTNAHLVCRLLLENKKNN